MVDARLCQAGLIFQHGLRIFQFHQGFGGGGLVSQQLLGQFQVQVGKAFGAGQHDVGQAHGLVELGLAQGFQLLVVVEHGVSFRVVKVGVVFVFRWMCQDEVYRRLLRVRLESIVMLRCSILS